MGKMKKILTIFIAIAFTFNSIVPAYALRPLANRHSANSSLYALLRAFSASKVENLLSKLSAAIKSGDRSSSISLLEAIANAYPLVDDQLISTIEAIDTALSEAEGSSWMKVDQGDSDLQRHFTSALAARGEEIVEPLINAICKANKQSRQGLAGWFVYTFGMMKTEAVGPLTTALKEALSSDNLPLARNFADALGRIGPQSAPALEQLCRAQKRQGIYF